MVLAALAACGQSSTIDPDWKAAQDVYQTCAACHGKQGEGGIGPSLAAVLETFPDCSTHVTWISLGSLKWKSQVGNAYGASNTPVKGAMPSFDHLTDTQLRQIAMYERVRFGGADLETERSACGLSG